MAVELCIFLRKDLVSKGFSSRDSAIRLDSREFDLDFIGVVEGFSVVFSLREGDLLNEVIPDGNMLQLLIEVFTEKASSDKLKDSIAF